MSNTNQAITPASRIDEISKHAMAVFGEPESFSKSLAVADAIADMRAALTPEVMKKVMGLMNTSLGFRTDRDPKVTPTDKQGNPMTPYSVDVVREVFIEANLRGFYPCNNEFNIIAGRWYGCLNGFERLVRKNPKVTDFRDTYSIPVMKEGGAIVKCSAQWKQDGQPQAEECEFAIRVNAGMGADAIRGKAKRKLYAAVYSRLSGVVTPEGDTDEEAINIKATATPVSQLFPKATDVPVKVVEQPTGSVTTKAPEVAAVTGDEKPQAAIARVMTSSEVPFDKFLGFIASKGLVTQQAAQSIAGFDDLPDKAALRLMSSAVLQAECIRKFGNVQAKA